MVGKVGNHHSQFSRLQSNFTINYPILQEKSSNLDLLDSTTLTLFPRPDVGFTQKLNKKKNVNNDGDGDYSKNINSQKLLLVEDYIKPKKNENHINTVKNSKSTFSLYQQKKKNRSIQQLKNFLNDTKLATKSFSSLNTTIIKQSLNSSTATSYSRNIVTGNSKNNTQPSSLDYQSEFYDYRLVLEQSNDYDNNNNNNVGTLKTESKIFEGTTTTDLYIQSLCQDLNNNYNKKDIETDREDIITIQCVVCEIPLFIQKQYFKTVSNFNEIVCENCIDTYNQLYYSSESNNNDNEDDDEIYEENGDQAVPIDIYSFKSDTNGTIYLPFDTTLQSSHNETDILGNINQTLYINNNNDDNILKRNLFDKLIKNLKDIEKKDLTLRQSITDFRDFNRQSTSYYNHSFWDFIKNKLVRRTE